MKLSKEIKKNWIELAAIVISIIALVISTKTSIDANRLQRIQALAMVSIPEVSQYTSLDEKDQFSCRYAVRIANQGGAASSIVGYDVVVSAFDSSNTSSTSRYSTARGSLLLDKVKYSTVLFEKPYDTTGIMFPYAVEESSAKEIYAELRIRSDYPLILNPTENPQENISWVRAKFIFRLLSGETAESPLVRCIGVEVTE